jgi:hypothetical protein
MLGILFGTTLSRPKSGGRFTPRRPLRSERSSFIVRLAGPHPDRPLVGRCRVDRHPAGPRRVDRLAFPAHAVRVPVFRGLIVVRLVVPHRQFSPVRWDFVVCPCYLSFSIELAARSTAPSDWDRLNPNRIRRRFGWNRRSGWRMIVRSGKILLK